MGETEGPLADSGEEIPPGFSAMLARGARLMAARPRLVKEGPRAFARVSGLNAAELAALWHVVTKTGCVKERRLRPLRVAVDCLRSLADALAQQERDAERRGPWDG